MIPENKRNPSITCLEPSNEWYLAIASEKRGIYTVDYSPEFTSLDEKNAIFHIFTWVYLSTIVKADHPEGHKKWLQEKLDKVEQSIKERTGFYPQELQQKRFYFWYEFRDKHECPIKIKIEKDY